MEEPAGLVNGKPMPHAWGVSPRETLFTAQALKRRKRWIGTLIVMLLLLGAANIFITLACVPKFEQIFQDALGNRPLPRLTQWIIAGRAPLIILATIWPIAGILTVLRLKLASVLWLYAPFMLSIGQTLITIYALFSPMVSVDGGMSDAPS